MASPRSPKKSETIEVRLSDQAKGEFMERCRREQLTASEAIRRFIDGKLASPSGLRARRTSWWRMLVAAAGGLALGVGMAGTSLARPLPAGISKDSLAEFERLDRNHDRMLSFEEYRAR